MIEETAYHILGGNVGTKILLDQWVYQAQLVQQYLHLDPKSGNKHAGHQSGARQLVFTCVASLYLLLCDIPVTPTPTTPTTVRFLIKFRVSRCKIYTLEGTGSNQEKLPVFNFIR